MIVVVSLVKPTASVRGLLRNLLLEPQANLFIGQLNSKQLGELVEMLGKKACNGIIAAQSKKHIMGVRLKQLSIADRSVIDFDGVQLVEKPYKSTR